MITNPNATACALGIIPWIICYNFVQDLKASELETVLGIEINNKLNFESHIKTPCSKAFQKQRALQRNSFRHAKETSSI